jgi:hypothetical protein
MAEGFERIGSSLLNLILGGVVLWVGQTTFRHSGILASVDQKFLAVDQQFTDVEKRHEGLRKWLESVVTDMKDANRSQFTAKDGDKLVGQVRQTELSATELERRVIARLGELEVRFAAFEAGQRDSTEVATLRWEVAQLRDAVSRAAAAQESAYHSAYQAAAERIARSAPVYLPQVEPRR